MSTIEHLSKPEAVKQQSRQLRGHICPRSHGHDRTLRQGRLLAAQIPRGLSRLRPRQRDRIEAARREQAVAVHGARPHSRRAADGRSISRPRRAGRSACQRIIADHDAAEGIQFHGVVKAGLKSAIAEINAALLTTLAACGDVVRTVTTIPAPIRDPVHRPARSRRPPAVDATSCRAPGLSRDLGRRCALAGKRRRGGAPRTRSTASAICRANSRSVSRSPRTTRSMS